MARRAAALKKEFQKDSEALLVSGGDFYANRGILAMHRGRFLGEMMLKMGYSAVAPGENELRYQLRPIMESVREGLPVTCANIYKQGEPVFKTYIIKKVRGWKVGIFALFGAELTTATPLEVKPPGRVCADIVRKLKDEECRMIILIAHMGSERLKRLAPSLEGVDLVIRGHAEAGSTVSDGCADRSIESFQDIGVPVLFAGDRGKLIGKAVICGGPGGRLAITDTTAIRLDTDSEKDPEFAGYLKEFAELEGSRLRETRTRGFISHDRDGRMRENFLGPSVCGRCHSDIASKFSSSPHQGAFERIRRVADREECLKCHTSGYGQYSGYGSKEGPGSEELEGVQCEACHGRGTRHSRDGKYRESARNSCVICHTKTRSPGFEYEAYMEKVLCYMSADSVEYKGDCGQE